MFLYYRKNQRHPWKRVAVATDPGTVIRSLGVQTGLYVGLRIANGESFWSLLSLEQAARKGYGTTIIMRPARAKEFFAGWRRETRGGRRVWVRQDVRQLTLQVRESGR